MFSMESCALNHWTSDSLTHIKSWMRCLNDNAGSGKIDDVNIHFLGRKYLPFIIRITLIWINWSPVTMPVISPSSSKFPCLSHLQLSTFHIFMEVNFLTSTSECNVLKFTRAHQWTIRTNTSTRFRSQSIVNCSLCSEFISFDTFRFL